MPQTDDLPEILQQRMRRQRKRSRVVMVSFAITLAATLAVFFIMAGALGRGSANRVLYVQPTPDGAWIVDQKLALEAQGSRTAGSFRMVEIAGDKVSPGEVYQGEILSAAVNEGTLHLTTASRLLRFKRDESGWQQLEPASLGINDPGAVPVTAAHGGTLWLFYAHGAELLARPAMQAEAAPVVLFKAESNIRRIHARGGKRAVWLSLMLEQDGSLMLLAVDPTRADPAQEDAAGQAVLRKAAAPGPAARSTLAIIGDEPASAVPVLATLSKESTTQGWQISALVAGEKPDGEWRELPALPLRTSAFGNEAAGFVTLLARDGAVHAWFSDRGDVRHCEAQWAGVEGFAWGEPDLVPLDETASEAEQLAWTALLFVLALALMSQGVYLVLNRERPQDRTLKVLLQRGGKDGKKAAENKLVYAAGPLRALALFIDLALTCPVLMLLQGVYDFRWEDAYGFLVFVNFAGLEGDILRTIAASVITLSVLVIYSLFCEIMWGRTLGKALFRLRVVDLEGEAPAPWRLVVRNVLKIAELIHWTVVMIPLGMMMFSGKQQRLGDYLGGTVVVVDVVPEESPDDIDV